MILVTGASGFIGGKLAERLVRDGHSVRCVYRRKELPGHLIELKEKGAEMFRADLADPDGCREMLSGIDFVFHSAGLASDWGPYDLFEKANINSTENLLKEGRKCRVLKFVILSSISVHGFGYHNQTTEQGPYYEPVSSYQKSKLAMESVALQYNDDSMAVTIIRPGNVYGPGDHTTMYPIFRAMEKGYMGYLDGGVKKTCPLFIDDLLNAILLAWKSENANGEIFNITGGEDITWKNLLDYSAEKLGITPPRLNMQSRLAVPVAVFLEFLFKLFRSSVSPPLTRYRVQQLIHDYNFSIDKARRLLDYRPLTGYMEGIGKTVFAYRQDQPVKT